MSRLNEKRIHDGLELHRQGMTGRAIARALRISRNTVRQIVEEHEQARQSPHGALPMRTVSPRPSEARSVPSADRRALQALSGHHRATCLRVPAREGLRRRLHRRQGLGAPYPPQEAAPAEPGDSATRPRGHGRVRLVAVSDHLHPCSARHPAGVRLHASLLHTQVLQQLDRKSTRLNSSHLKLSRMPSSA